MNAQSKASLIISQYFDLMEVVFSDTLMINKTDAMQYTPLIRFISASVHNLPEFVANAPKIDQCDLALKEMCRDIYAKLPMIGVPSTWQGRLPAQAWEQLCRTIAEVIDRPPLYGFEIKNA